MIELRKVHYRYSSGLKALLGVDLSIAKGELTGLVGPNGAGKSTLLRMLAGQNPSSGESFFEGHNMALMKPRQLARRIALVPQSGVFTFPFTVTEIVTMGRFARQSGLGFREDEQREVVERCLAWTSLQHLSRRPVSELSGGEGQRVRIAQALAQEPDLLLLDEPTAHLDVHLQVELMELLARLNQEAGLTVVLCLHDLNLASAYCRRLLLLDKGKLTLDGPPETFFEDPLLQQVFQVEFGRWTSPGHTPRVFPLKLYNTI